MTLTMNDQSLLPAAILIGGEWRRASDGGRLDVTDPATDAVFADVPDGTPQDARDAVDAADAAFPAWRALPAKERAKILRRWNDPIVASQADLGKLISREQGKPLAEGRGEVLYAASYVEWFAEEAHARTAKSSPRRRHLTVATKSNGIAISMPWWDGRADAVGRDYPEVTVDKEHIGSARPSQPMPALDRRRPRVLPSIQRHAHADRPAHRPGDRCTRVRHRRNQRRGACGRGRAPFGGVKESGYGREGSILSTARALIIGSIRDWASVAGSDRWSSRNMRRVQTGCRSHRQGRPPRCRSA